MTGTKLFHFSRSLYLNLGFPDLLFSFGRANMLSKSQWDLIWIKLLYMGRRLSSLGICRTWATWPTWGYILDLKVTLPVGLPEETSKTENTAGGYKEARPCHERLQACSDTNRKLMWHQSLIAASRVLQTGTWQTSIIIQSRWNLMVTFLFDPVIHVLI